MAISTNKGTVKSDLIDCFVGDFKFSLGLKMGDNHTVKVEQRSLLQVDKLSKNGNVTNEPYPEPCSVIKLSFPEKELVNKDCRSKKLTWFLNQCLGKESYIGVAAQQTLSKLENDGIVSVAKNGGMVTVERIKWQDV